MHAGVDQAEKNLLPLVARGDQDAARACLDRYGALVWSLARRTCGSTADAEDAVQDVFVSLWKNAGRFDPARGSEVTFVATIARRRLIDRMRRVGRRRGETTIDTGFPVLGEKNETETQATMREEVAVARAALAELNDDQRRVLQMSIGHGLSHERIAEATGIPLGTVKTHIRRGLLRVRSMIEDKRAPSARGVEA